MRRGEIGIGVIIVIALGLIVLVTLAGLLVQQRGKADAAINSCNSGVCISESECRIKRGAVIATNACEGISESVTSSGWYVRTFSQGGSVCCVLP